MPLLTLITSTGLLGDALPGADAALLFGVKVLFIIAGIIYLLFAILVSRQITIMSKTVDTTASPKIKLLGMAHLITSILILIYFFIVL